MAKKPHEIRIGRIKATVWENTDESSKTVRYSTQFCRLYKPDGESDWKSSDSFNVGDLLVLAKLASRVHDYIVDQKQDAE